jgi:pyruvate dehydrogenase E2 component (dihydrolipoamide acetyltransferase)
MASEIKLPELGENIEKGDVVRVLVNAGDTIKPDQALIELETDKATIEVPSTTGGKILEVKVKVGDKVKVGQVLFIVERRADADAKDSPTSTTSAKSTEPAKSAPPAKTEPSGSGPTGTYRTYRT